eukprot:jgi/Mesen1/778/ME000110S_11049
MAGPAESSVTPADVDTMASVAINDSEARVLPPTETSSTPLETMVGLAKDAGEHVKTLDQASFFRAVGEGNPQGVKNFLSSSKVNVNAYNDEGVTAVFLAVYHYENTRDLEMVKLLLSHGAKVLTKAATPPLAHKISIVRHNKAHPHGEVLLETKKLSLDHKTPLLVALELKSLLYVRGWEYRHWDEMLDLLSQATLKELEQEDASMAAGGAAALLSLDDVAAAAALAAVHAAVHRGWAAVFASGAHDVVEVWAEGQHVQVLKLLLVTGSRVLKFNIEDATAMSFARLEVKEASYSIVRAMMEFLYTGSVDPALVEARGVDLFNAAHKYGVDALARWCEMQLVAAPENWIKLLTAAVNCGSNFLMYKCAKSIHGAMHKRMDNRFVSKTSFSHHSDGGPQQLFQHVEKQER